MAFSTTDFRYTMARFATGVTVVTTLNGPKMHAITVNAFTSVSLDPPLLLICIDRRTESHKFIVQSGVFTINILSANQENLSDRFAGREPAHRDFFEDIPLRIGTNGCAIFTQSLAFVECHLTNTYDGGDHSIFIGTIENLGLHAERNADGQPTDPLLYYKSAYTRFAGLQG